MKFDAIMYDISDGIATITLNQPDELITAARVLTKEVVDNSSRIFCTMLRHLFWRCLGESDLVTAHCLDTAEINQLALTPEAS